jgi:TRAP-type uncharacterized transport system substrate-binding protein
MRFASVAATVALLGTLMAAVSVPSADAAEHGTRAEAVAMVKRVQARVAKDGLEAALRAINSGAKEFNDRDIFAFVLDFNGLNRANSSTPAVTGKNIFDLKDQDGRFIVRDMIALAKEKGSGWMNYRWLNPATKTIEDKSTYVERIGENHLVGVGIYRNEQPNTGTVGLISGSPNSDDTYLQMAYDLAEVLNDGDIRVLPIAGIGGPRNIRDVRYLKGVDIGLTQTSILNNFRRSNERMGQSENKIVYIAKLFNEEVHLLARTDITSIEQLKGLKVNLDAKGSGTSYSMRDIFKALNIEVEEVSMSQVEAIEKVRSGEIAATALIAGKPVRSVSSIGPADGLHFVTMPFVQALIADYLPAALGHEDYPDLIPAGQSVETIAVGAVLITYDGTKPGAGDRHQRIEKFVEAFFSKINEFKKPPRHPKWREVNIAATLPGWTRFDAAQSWLDRQRTAEQAKAATPGGNARLDAASALGQVDTVSLYQDFLRWRQQRVEAGQAGKP